MSDTENKSETNKSNFIIPFVLLLVSAIVIVATFYGDEYKTLVAQTDTSEDKQDDTGKILAEETVEETPADNANEALANITTDAEQTTSQESETNVTAETALVADVKAAESADNTIVVANSQSTEPENTASVESKEQNNGQSNNTHQQNTPVTVTDTESRVRPVAYTPYQGRQYNRGVSKQEYDDRVARAQEQAKQYHEMMQQRRQSHMQEMQARRQHYEAKMHAQHEKQIEIFKAQKAIYQQAQQDRRAINQKIQEIHNRISDMHEEIHQIMQESQTGLEKSGADQQEHTAEIIEKI
jgi:hypothetical protein